MHVRGTSVSWLTVVDDDHRASLTSQLQCSRQARRRPSDDDDVAMSLDGAELVLTHDNDATVSSRYCIAPCGIRNGRVMDHQSTIEDTVRDRIRSLRTSLGLSLDEMAARTHLSASTISRIETGNRTISLDVLVPLARALHVDLDTLLEADDDDDVIIRPTPNSAGDRTTWMLSRATGSTIAIKMRLEPTDAPSQQRVHPGHDWFFVLEGRVLLTLGDREITVETGEAAEFGTMTPHATRALGGPAELIMIFDRDGQRAHLHSDTSG